MNICAKTNKIQFITYPVRLVCVYIHTRLITVSMLHEDFWLLRSLPCLEQYTAVIMHLPHQVFLEDLLFHMQFPSMVSAGDVPMQ